MPRIRTIKPEFWTSAQILECSTNARLLFVGLWNFCDDTGRHPFNAKQVKAEVFPADDFTQDDILGMLYELSENGLIILYAVDGKEFFHVSGWHHQRIDKPQPSRYPEPLPEHSENIPRTLPPDSKGKDSKGKDSKPKKPRSQKTKLPDDFALTDHLRELATTYWKKRNRCDLNPDDEFEKFLANHRGKGTRMEDWNSAWTTWYSNAVQFSRPPIGFPSRQPQKTIDEVSL